MKKLSFSIFTLTLNFYSIASLVEMNRVWYSLKKIEYSIFQVKRERKVKVAYVLFCKQYHSSSLFVAALLCCLLCSSNVKILLLSLLLKRNVMYKSGRVHLSVWTRKVCYTKLNILLSFCCSTLTEIYVSCVLTWI